MEVAVGRMKTESKGARAFVLDWCYVAGGRNEDKVVDDFAYFAW
jgi:hypothetical protein